MLFPSSCVRINTQCFWSSSVTPSTSENSPCEKLGGADVLLVSLTLPDGALRRVSKAALC